MNSFDEALKKAKEDNAKNGKTYLVLYSKENKRHYSMREEDFESLEDVSHYEVKLKISNNEED